MLEVEFGDRKMVYEGIPAHRRNQGENDDGGYQKKECDTKRDNQKSVQTIIF